MYHYELADPIILGVHRQFASIFRLLAQFPPGQRAAAERNLRRVYFGFNERLDDIARVSALEASERIRRNITKTSLRPDTGRKPHIRNLIRSRKAPRINGLATGVVLIADEDMLNKAKAFGDDYTYWLAQEYGMPGVPPPGVSLPEAAPHTSMVGKVIRGYFAGGGGAGPWAAPNPNQFRTHPVFLPRLTGPVGTIQTPLKPRYFIHDGAMETLKDWQAAVRAISSQTLAQAESAIGLTLRP